MTDSYSEGHPSPQQLKLAFEHACQLHEKGVPHEALTIYRRLVVILPGSILLHFNCGLALFELAQFPEAEEQYLKAILIRDDFPDIHYNRGLNLRHLQRLEDAIASFTKALSLGDTSLETIYSIALCHQDMQAHSEAARFYEIILAKDPGHLSSLNNYAYLSHKTGDTAKAYRLYRQLLRHNPGHQAARHMVAALSGETPDSAPLGYVEEVFDNYAGSFERELLHTLRYQTPQDLRQLYREIFPNDSRKLVVDLGCGTGLAGREFHDSCQELIGVDISTEMLKQAAQKSLYHDLIQEDILQFLVKETRRYDMIIAADVFTYMGDLKEIFTECARVAHSGAIFVFSVETTQDTMYELKRTGRFGHSHCHIERLSQTSGWHILESRDSNLRRERGEWIKGHLFILKKTNAATSPSP